MPSTTYDIAIIGGGIVGLATTLALLQANPARRIIVLEKETEVAAHQTGHNSGVIHSGIYYKPGTLKAQLCVSGAQLMMAFCDAHQIHYELCGKVIVATDERELPRLDNLYERATANGVPGVVQIDAGELREIEPNAAGLRGLYSPKTGIVDYTAVAQAMRRWYSPVSEEIWPSPADTGPQGVLQFQPPAASRMRELTCSTCSFRCGADQASGPDIFARRDGPGELSD